MPDTSTDMVKGGHFVYNKNGSMALTRPMGEPIHVKAETGRARFEYKGPENSRQSDRAMEICAIMTLKN